VRFNHPYAVAVDRADNIYVSDSASDTIRKVTAAGGVTTLAGLSGYTGYTTLLGAKPGSGIPRGCPWIWVAISMWRTQQQSYP